MELSPKHTAFFHLPGLFEFFDLYQLFLPLFRHHRDYFYEWCDIGSIYGAPAGCLWGGGRIGSGSAPPQAVLSLMEQYGISSRLTFSNSLLQEKHLSDKACNELCAIFNQSQTPRNGVIIHSDLLLNYLKQKFPNLYFVSSTTKVLTRFNDFKNELSRDDFLFVVPDFRFNTAVDILRTLPQPLKDKAEFLCNECCWFGCRDRKRCYETVSRQILDDSCPDFGCTAPDAADGYRFSKAMDNPGFIGIQDIHDVFLPNGFANFKIEGRDLGSALLLEFILYYMTKPECQLKVREAIYLDAMLDLF